MCRHRSSNDRNCRRPGVRRFHIRLHRRTEGRSLPPRSHHSLSPMAKGRVSIERRRPFRDAIRPSLQPFASRCFHGFISWSNAVYSESIRSSFSRIFNSLARKKCHNSSPPHPGPRPVAVNKRRRSLAVGAPGVFRRRCFDSRNGGEHSAARAQRDQSAASTAQQKPNARSAISKSRTIRQPFSSKYPKPFHWAEVSKTCSCLC